MMQTSRCQECGLQVAHIDQADRLAFEDYHHKQNHSQGAVRSSLDEPSGIQWFGLNSEVSRLPAPGPVFLLTRTQDNRKVAVTHDLFNAMQAFRDSGGLDSPLLRQTRNRVRTEGDN